MPRSSVKVVPMRQLKRISELPGYKKKLWLRLMEIVPSFNKGERLLYSISEAYSLWRNARLIFQKSI